ncbi:MULTISPECIES: DMT family transporter [Planktothrix]|uniref:DMT family transporter n=1 Tax=Planktothrix mougeotii LEGE 06226 TaxID=1828728 RepID=A0ABR9UG89_9CYAN|nr:MULTISPECIES: DMT family transporter [Planktothrix]MBD2484447.1 DMT family transporter [Planktothrix sp. FACHB-1365]MBE9145475.1 DMT family transporter [Planktothrix mougeotii LEGE 06226]
MSIHSTSGRWRLGLGLALLTTFLWGILPLGLAIILQSLDVYTVTWFRFLIAFILLGGYLATRQQLPDIQKWRSMPWGLLAIATIFLAANYVLFLQGLALTSPTNAEVLIQLSPVLMGLGAIVFFKERYTGLQGLGLGVLTLGFSLFFHEQLRILVTASERYLLGSFIVGVASICWAIYALAQKQLLQQLPSTHIMGFIYGSCTILYLPVATPTAIFTLTPFQLFILFFCGLNTLIAYGAFAESLEHWEASRVSAVLALAPIITLIAVDLVALLFPLLIKPEHLTNLAIIGAILVVLGSMMIALGRRKTEGA